MSAVDEFEKLKRRAEFFKKGTIIPQRILRGPRKQKHGVTFGSDSYAVPTGVGYLVITLCGRMGSAVNMRNVRNAAFFGSPYTPRGGTRWFGNAHLSGEEFAAEVIDELNKMNGRIA